MVAHKNDLLTSENQRNHALGFSRLGGFVDENGPELHLRKSGITGTHASTADDVGCTQDLTFSSPSKLLELLFILAGQLADISLELVQFVELNVRVIHANLFVE